MSRATNVVELYSQMPDGLNTKSPPKPVVNAVPTHLPPVPGETKNLPARQEDLPRDWSVMPKPEKKPEGNLVPKQRGTYKLEPIIKPLPSPKTLTYVPDEPPIDYYAYYDIERPTPSGDNPGIYKPKGKVVALEDLDPNSMLYQMWALDFAIGEAWVKGQDRFLLDKETEFVPEPPKATSDPFALAEREDFYAMCEHSLWGKEKTDDQHEFAAMLRGLVEAFAPQNRWHLEMLSTIVDLQWKIRRATRLQQKLFEHGPSGHDNLGVPTRTVNATTVNEQLKSLRSQLEQAIRTYKMSAG